MSSSRSVVPEIEVFLSRPDRLVSVFRIIRYLKRSRCKIEHPVYLNVGFPFLTRLSLAHTRFLVEFQDSEQHALTAER